MYILNPLNWFSTIVEISNQGLWSIFGATFNGIVLWIIWLVEAGIITALAIGLNLESDISLYSKTFNKKYQKFILDKDFKPMYVTDEFKKNLFENFINTIENLDFGMVNYCGKISIYYLEREENQYLSIVNQRKSSNGYSNDYKKVITHLQISKKDADILMQKFKAKKPSFTETFSF